MDAPARPLTLAEKRAAIESEAWMASLWDASFAALRLAVRKVEDDGEPEDWKAAASLFVRRANQHGWSDADIANFAKALQKCR
jgi:hypothetical protein